MELAVRIGFLFCGLAMVAGSFNYEGYKIYETIPVSKSEADFLNYLSEQTDEIDFLALTKIPNMPSRALVPPKYQSKFENALNNIGMDFTIVNSNVAKSIQIEKVQNDFMRSISPQVGFTKFHRHNEINEYLEALANSYSNRVSVKRVGTSFEGREMKTITITNGDGRIGKKVIFVDAGIHAREWIAPSMALYIIFELVEKYEQNKNLLENHDWIILPVVNPDGYEYTHTNQRFWRKTRKPSSALCEGTDGNRNFDFHWGEVGASDRPCADTFRGESAFSEPETKVVQDILHSISKDGKFYLTLHSYGNYLLYPWGYTSSLPDTWKDLDDVSQAGADAIKSATGGRYTVGSSTNVLYAAAGGSDDYAFGVAKIPIAITLELPAGGSGFDVKPAQIKGIVEETWVGIKAMAERVAQKY